MTLQIATDVDGVATSRALARSATALAVVFLTATAVIAALFIPVTGRTDLLLGILALVVVGLGVAAALATANHLRAVIYTVVAGVALYAYAMVVIGVTLADSGANAPASDFVLLSMPEFAVLVAGVAARSLARSLALGLVALISGPGLVLVAAAQNGMRLAVDVPVLAAFVTLSLFVTALWFGRREAARGTIQMLGSALAEEGDLARARFTARATDWLGDTVLADLRAIAATPAGPLPESTLQAIDRDLLNLTDASQVLTGPDIGGSATRSLSSVPLLIAVVRTAEQKGLRIRITGDVEAVNDLRAAVMRNLERAIGECLDNVLRHAGVSDAEIAVYSSRPEISVMISDSGAGFDVDAVGDDTVGLRLAVVDSISEVGGSVQIWSRPGTGTAVFMTVPVGRS
ncbi:ATP-binding protein [Herbiconiux liangxiaofengii]|uniref:ATP-binding protein n=1 Tax=Herbiconiux liangxiaofengii TaxID=3342795 RepID=UPI0035B91756